MNREKRSKIIIDEIRVAVMDLLSQDKYKRSLPSAAAIAKRSGYSSDTVRNYFGNGSEVYLVIFGVDSWIDLLVDANKVSARAVERQPPENDPEGESSV